MFWRSGLRSAHLHGKHFIAWGRAPRAHGFIKKRILWQRDRLGEKVSATEADNLDPVLWDLRKNERTEIVLWFYT